jgi:hypothetical protein
MYRRRPCEEGGMTEERFDQVDARLDRLEAGQTELRGTVANLVIGQAELRGEIERLDGRIDTLDRHMHVLHEETLQRIAAISEEPLATKAEMNRGFSELKALISRSIGPLELAVRHLLREPNNRG